MRHNSSENSGTHCDFSNETVTCFIYSEYIIFMIHVLFWSHNLMKTIKCHPFYGHNAGWDSRVPVQGTLCWVTTLAMSFLFDQSVFRTEWEKAFFVHVCLISRGKYRILETIVDVMSSLVIIRLRCGNHSTFTDPVVDFTALDVLRLLSF